LASPYSLLFLDPATPTPAALTVAVDVQFTMMSRRAKWFMSALLIADTAALVARRYPRRYRIGVDVVSRLPRAMSG
jgi:hypothetical protein